jgi:steroid delta-isomerase-like uncharacterized protein
MPRIVITHAVKDVEHWLGGSAERAAALPGATNTTDLVALDGSSQAGVSFDFDDLDSLKGVLSSMPPELAAQAESHGVVLPMTVYVEAQGSTRTNAATMQRAYDLINEGDLDGFGDLLADGFVEHDEVPGLPPTKEGVKELFRSYRTSFPDFHMHVEEIIAGGDRTVARVTASGTQDGELMGIPASGRRATVQLIDIMGFDPAGSISEHWGVADMLSLLQQLGAVPAGPPVPAG